MSQWLSIRTIAALVFDVYSAEITCLGNDANIICMGAFTTGSKNHEKIVTAFLTNAFITGCKSLLKVDVFR